MPTKNTVRNSKKTTKTTKPTIKSNMDKLNALLAQKKVINSNIEELTKLVDVPSELGTCMVQRRNILFINFEDYMSKVGKDLIYLNNEFDFCSREPVESKCNGNYDCNHLNLIDKAIEITAQIALAASDLLKKLDEAKDNGCEYVVDSDYTLPENFDFHEED